MFIGWMKGDCENYFLGKSEGKKKKFNMKNTFSNTKSYIRILSKTWSFSQSLHILVAE